MSEKLKLCRWCGGPARVAWTDSEGREFVRCDTQGCLVATSGTVSIEAWNRRAPLTVADAMTVPEVRALVDLARPYAHHRDGSDDALFDPLAAMEVER